MKKSIQQGISITSAVAMTLSLCACNPLAYNPTCEGKEDGLYQAKLGVVTPAVPESIDPAADAEHDRDENVTWGSSQLLNFVVPDDFEKLEKFDKDEFAKKNPYISYDSDQIIEASEAYFDHIQEFQDSGWVVKFTFALIDNNDLPEMVYVYNSGNTNYGIEYHFCTYDFDNKEVLEIGSFHSDYNILYYKEKENILWYSEWDYSGEKGTDYYVTINKDKRFEVVASFESSLWSIDDSDEYHVNNIPTDYNTYIEYMDALWYVNSSNISPESWMEMVPLADTYDFSGLINQYEAEVKPGAVDKAYEVYEDYLSKKYGEFRYEFVYLDYNEIPELVIATIDDYKNKYTVYRADIYENYSTGKLDGYVFEIGSIYSDSGFDYLEYQSVSKGIYLDNGYQYTSYYAMRKFKSAAMQVFQKDPSANASNGHFYLNGCEISSNRYEQFLSTWDNYEFASINYNDMNSNIDAKEIKKLYNAKVKAYAGEAWVPEDEWDQW